MQKNKHKVIRYLIWSVGFLTLFWVGCSMLFSMGSLFSAVQNSPGFPRISDTYKEIFPNYDSTKTVPSFTFLMAHKPPKSTFSINSGKDRLLIYKLGIISSGKPLFEVLQISWHASFTTRAGKVYDESFRSANMVFSDLEEPPKMSDRLYIDISGDLIESKLGADSLQCYSLNLEYMGGKYKKQSFYDFFCKKTNRLIGENLQVELAFIRRNSCVYMVLLSPVSAQTTLGQPDQLYNLLK